MLKWLKADVKTQIKIYVHTFVTLCSIRQFSWLHKASAWKYSEERGGGAEVGIDTFKSNGALLSSVSYLIN